MTPIALNMTWVGISRLNLLASRRTKRCATIVNQMKIQQYVCVWPPAATNHQLNKRALLNSNGPHKTCKKASDWDSVDPGVDAFINAADLPVDNPQHGCWRKVMDLHFRNHCIREFVPTESSTFHSKHLDL